MWYFFFFPRRVWLCELRKLSESRCPERGGGRLPRKNSSQSHPGLLALYSHLPLDPAEPMTAKHRRRQERNRRHKLSKNFPRSPKQIPSGGRFIRHADDLSRETLRKPNRPKRDGADEPQKERGSGRNKVRPGLLQRCRHALHHLEGTNRAQAKMKRAFARYHSATGGIAFRTDHDRRSPGPASPIYIGVTTA